MTQNKELEIARFIVEKTNKNLFLTGKAGTGKTTFLKDVKRYTKKKHVVLAPTGIAAVNAGAMTIHSFFQFGFGPYVKGVSVPDQSFKMKKAKLELIQSLELLIIDEISMVRADLLDHINDELQRIRHNSEPFGGVQLLMVGDLQQLPPVAKKEDIEILNEGHYESLYFFDSKALRNSDYYCIDLKNVYRQTDQHFIDILNRARDGKVTREDLNELNSRFTPESRATKGDIHLMTHNRMADEINQREMDAIPEEASRYEATVTGTFHDDEHPTNKILDLKKGAQVMFVKNDPDGHYVNGTIGEIESQEEDTIHVKISDSEEVIELEQTSWNNIRYKLIKTTDENGNEKTEIAEEIIGTFTQYPIKPAWAITIHKSQGMTFDKAIIDAHAAFVPGQTYVALSRCRTLEGITLSSKLYPNAFKTDSIVTDYMQGAVHDIDALARAIDYTPFDYDRTEQPKDEPLIVNENVYNALKAWRLATAREQEIPAYVIMTDKSMEDLAKVLPEDISELSGIKGFGPVKIEKYGAAILEVIRDSKNDSNVRIAIHALQEDNAKEAAPQRAPREKTWAITYALFLEGKTIKEIAEERALTETTILSHLSRYVESGELDVHRLVSDDVIAKISSYMGNRNLSDVTMKEIFEHFNQEISYGDIRLVLAHLKRTQQLY